VRYYKEWLNFRERLASPEKRRLSPHGQQTQSDLEQHLSGNNAGDWADCLPPLLLSGSPDPDTLMRYSAELSTILTMAEDPVERMGATSLADFIGSYSAIHIIYDDLAPDGGERHLAYIAAKHLECYINRLVRHNVANLLKVSGLSRTDAERLIGTPQEKSGLTLLASRLSDLIKNNPQLERIDFVISGGYKLYGVALAHLTARKRPEVRLIYIHETGRKLLVFSERELILDGVKHRNPFQRGGFPSEGGPE
jgi:hypothetical protein